MGAKGAGAERRTYLLTVAVTHGVGNIDKTTYNLQHLQTQHGVQRFSYIKKHSFDGYVEHVGRLYRVHAVTGYKYSLYDISDFFTFL